VAHPARGAVLDSRVENCLARAVGNRQVAHYLATRLALPKFPSPTTAGPTPLGVLWRALTLHRPPILRKCARQSSLCRLLPHLQRMGRGDQGFRLDAPPSQVGSGVA
jgi:hypothetical protein